ncbi:uncharacterized protein LOC123679123 isoform X2 [Harmonia axyridis]|uniref:uncharacterized protein LOC123679123 isoform X2 n=1 Tax=Harmonia axyridis TaxID=115357 RepID=UPI001E277924|nr:uncharacterized protein LOC123679123 isoform X2 [Harmonia axyridis]
MSSSVSTDYYVCFVQILQLILEVFVFHLFCSTFIYDDMYTNNDGNDQKTPEGSSNKFSCTGHSNQTNINLDNLSSIHTNQNSQTPHRGNQGHELREFNCNYRQCENQIYATNRCGSLCQDGSCRDPNCRSYWNITLTPCSSNREPVRRLSKENKVSPSDARRKSLDFQRTSPSTNLPRTSDKEKLNSPPGSAPYITRTSDQEIWDPATGVQTGGISIFSPRTSQNETKNSAVNFIRPSDQKMKNLTGSYPNVSRTDLEETNLAPYSPPYTSRTSDQERRYSATGFQIDNISTYSPRTSQNETKNTAVNFTRTSDQKKMILAGSSPNVSRTNYQEETNPQSSLAKIISRITDQERGDSASGVQQASSFDYSPRTSRNEKNISAVNFTRNSDQKMRNLTGSSPNVSRSSDLEETNSDPYILRTSDPEMRHSATGVQIPSSSTYSSWTSPNDKKNSAVNFRRTSDQKKISSAESSPNVSLTTYQGETNSPSSSAPYISRTSDQDRRNSATDFRKAVNFARTSDQKMTNLTGSYPNISRTSDLGDKNLAPDSAPYISRTSDQGRRNSATGVQTGSTSIFSPRISQNEKNISAVKFTIPSDGSAFTKLTSGNEKKIPGVNILRTSDQSISRTSDLEETNLTTGVRRDQPGKVLSLKESLMEVQQRRQEDNQTSCTLKKIEGKKRTSPINLLRSINSVNPNPSAISMVSVKSTDKLATIKEENHPVNSTDIVPEIKCGVKCPPVRTIIKFYDSITDPGVQVQEIDIGQPCLGCETCKGYEAHSWSKDKFEIPASKEIIEEKTIRSTPKVTFANQKNEEKSETKSKIPFIRQKSADKFIIVSKNIFCRQKSKDKLNISPKLAPTKEKSKSIFDFAFSRQKNTSKDKSNTIPAESKNKNEKKNKNPPVSEMKKSKSECEIVPRKSHIYNGIDMDEFWKGITIECIKILSLYCKIFEQDKKDLARYPFLIKNCRNCKCPRDNHAISEFAARSRIGFSASNESLEPRTTGYTFVPSGLTKANQVAQYYSLFPSHEVPKMGSEGEVYRSQRLVKQLPKQDLSLNVCKFVETNQKGSFQDFIQARNEIALDIGYVKTASSAATCEYCEKTIPNGQYSIAAMKMGDLLWHPTCFRCNKCDDLLVDLAYCVYKDKIYCERHYAECLKPRCEGCDELIFSGEYTKAMNKDWHGQHFCCWQCDESLTGQRYVLRDDHPYCVSCYESVFANACEKCSRTIGIDSKDLSYKDKHWHEACFLCTTCGESLVDKQFGSKGERIYCGRCYDNQFASRCDGCNEIFRAGTKKMEYKTRQWHEKCFCCCVCKVPIGTQSFIPREQEIYCAKCYEEKFATRCIKCNKVITSGGVTYKNEPWHRECFTCTHCSKSLAGERFTSREEKPYCAECFGELFAKRCFACNKPITGIGGTKFISFEDRHWHNDCFFCAMCRSSLVGRGFITDQDDIICPECAKQKLL